MRLNLRRLSESVNPFLGELFKYPGLIFPGFEIEEDIKNLKNQIQDFHGKIILEFGSGSGEHLIGLAELYPDCLVIGFEIRFKRAVRTIEKAQGRGVNNIRIFRGRADTAARIFSERQISQIYINFPDPWEKKRWLKHRILTKNSIELYFPLLTEQGFFSVKTDHLEYFDSFVSELSNTDLEIYEITRDHQESEFQSANIKTEFEKLFRGQNKKINYIRFGKRGLNQADA